MGNKPDLNQYLGVAAITRPVPFCSDDNDQYERMELVKDGEALKNLIRKGFGYEHVVDFLSFTKDQYIISYYTKKFEFEEVVLRKNGKEYWRYTDKKP